jgi:3'-phosphoadenosine 5'-phosphosulfate sulfotransferase (PAPS reductase)/FAD synthetase
MSFWLEQDVLLYIYEHKLPICSVYGEVVKDNEVEGQYDFEDLGIFDLGRPTLKTTGCTRTGCCLCGFGAHMPGDTRYVDLKRTHPGLYGLLDKCKNNGYTMREAIECTNEHGNLNIKLE